MTESAKVVGVSPECIRKLLFAKGYRYRLHDTRLPGKPDLVFPKYGAVVFVHGCFWHGHDCSLFRWPASNAAFWRAKIAKNQKNDREALDALVSVGWRVLSIWECALRGPFRLTPEEIALVAERWLRSNRKLKVIEGSRKVASSAERAHRPTR